MLREMSYREYRQWELFYAQCGGYPHEVEDIRWARAMLATASPGKNQAPFKLDDFLMVHRELPGVVDVPQELLTAPSQEAVDFVHRLAANG